jgi:hypothetical protein
MKSLIQKLLKARRNQLAIFDEKPEWHRNFGHMYVNRAFFFMFVPFMVTLFALGSAIYNQSLEVFGMFVLALAASILLAIPNIRWYLKIYGDEDA